MSISPELREFVRRRANYACEFCGVSEEDVGGELTIDHLRPKSRGGDDDPENLIYACSRCNLYKQDYWPNQPSEVPLWNPRQETVSLHMLELEDGQLIALTAVGERTIQRLRLNRPALISYRLRKQTETEELRLLSAYLDITTLLVQLNEQLTRLVGEQQQLLLEQRALIRLLLTEEDNLDR
jgi:hypothetical protein